MARNVPATDIVDSDLYDPRAPMGAATRGSAWYQTLRRLDAGEAAVPLTDEGASELVYAIGGLRVVRPVLVSLARHDLVESVGEIYVISSPGRAFLRRTTATRQRDKKGAAPRGRARRQGKSIRRRADPLPDIYRAQHQLLEKDGLPEGARNAATGDFVVMNRAETPLGWLRHRKDKSGRPFLSGAQFEAGEALRRDFEIAGMSPRLTTDLSGRLSGGRFGFASDRMNATEYQLAAKQRFDRAIAFVGPGLGDVLLRVCCFLEGIEVAEKALGWPSRSGKLVLGLALDRLARHYGLN